MAIAPGVRLGPYEVISLLGEGGMGKVWRAHHSALRRDDALKVLPDAFAADADRLARFRREAQVLASLNHPNIAHVYGLEQADGIQALVMELVEGPTLADRIAQGPIPVDEALPIAKQIAEALEAAHERGIIHRDLKPANIKLRPDGTVKVLDFGLAKALEPMSATGVDATASPTITSPALMTGVGVLLGTAAYMSPEQARGKPVDKRSDIWAFGCVLYEMLTGTRAFTGDDVPVTLARVVERDPDWAMLPANTPPSIRRLLRHCLEKDRKRRLDSTVAIRLEIEDPQLPEAIGTRPTPAVAQQRNWRRALLPAAMLLIGGAIAGGAVWFATRPVSPRVTRLTITPPAAAALTINGNDGDLAITPDGLRPVYVGNNGTQLFVRALDAIEPVAIFRGLPREPFVSPDGQWVGFVDNLTELKKVAITGGAPVTIAQLDAAGPRGSAWLPDGTIVFATQNAATGLQRVSAAGGMPTVLTKADRARGEADHQWPEVLPGGRAILFTAISQNGGLDAAQVVVLNLQTGAQKVLVRGGSHAHYMPGGYLVYGAAGTLRAVPFDMARLEISGTPVPVVPQVVMTTFGAVDAVVSGNGTLAYVSGGPVAIQRTFVWVDRQGRETPIAAPGRFFVYPRIAPDGARVAAWSNDLDSDIWVWDFARATLTRATFGSAMDNYPSWTPDGKRLIFSSERTGGARNLFWQSADGTGAVERLTESPHTQNVTDISPDGGRVIFTEIQASGDVMELTLSGSHQVRPLIQTPFNEMNGVISTDGRWLAYEANDSGQFEIYVRPYPDVNSGRWQVSNGGGTRPLWARNGQELFYVAPSGAVMTVSVERGATWAATTPTTLLKQGYLTTASGNPGRTYDVSPDGQRFLLLKQGTPDQLSTPPQIVVVQNWDQELKRLVPTN